MKGEKAMLTKRTELSLKVYDVMKEVKAMLKEKEEKAEWWESELSSAEVECITAEDLILLYDTPEMNKRLARAYNKERHYHYIYRKICNECEELEEALAGLEKADYWL